MKLKGFLALMLAFALLIVCGCSKDGNSTDGKADKEDNTKAVLQSPNFTFTEDMALYMASYTNMMLAEEFDEAGVDIMTPLSEQMRTETESWEDYLFAKTVENMEKILLYCESAYREEYTVTEGMRYKASENITYLASMAQDAGMTSEEYIRMIFGDSVTMDGLEACTQMMCLCEGYEIDLLESEEIPFEEIVTLAGEEPEKLLKFNALRYTTKDKAIAESLAAANDRSEFLNIISGISGIDQTDLNNNKTPDSIEVTDAVVSTDIAGMFAKENGRSIGDTDIYENNGSYTVTMLLSLPERNDDPVWNFRLIFISASSSTDPELDATSLLSQWKEKQGGEEGFSNLAARYSDDPSAYYGGIYSGTLRQEMPNEDIAKWVCDRSRVAGDTTTISAGDDGTYMLYYISGYTTRWQYEAEKYIKNQRVDEKIAKFKEDISSNIKLNEELMREIIKKL